MERVLNNPFSEITRTKNLNVELIQRRFKFLGIVTSLLSDCVGSVSYTHLDVYKRQV